MTTDPLKQRILDEEHLRLLSMFHYISGALTILFSSIFVYSPRVPGPPNGESRTARPGTVTGPRVQNRSCPSSSRLSPWSLALGIAYGVAQIISGRFLAKHRYRTFSLIVAIPNVLLIPYGTILGVLTLVVLGRESVKSLYAEKS